MTRQKLYGGVRLIDGQGPCLDNVARLDSLVVPITRYMMQTGMMVDLSHFAKLEVDLARDMEQITEDVRRITGHYVNLDSGDQVADLLFVKIGLKQARIKFTKSGDRESVADEVLTAIQHDHPVVGKIQDFKELSKLLGTYVRPMPKLARHVGFGEWRMFPNLGQSRVPSGRFNARDPNLLAIPTRTERGRDIRKGFITRDGWTYVSVDLSQIEPRVAAHRSKDPNLLRVYRNGEDIYSDFATAAFSLPDERYQNEAGKWIYPTVDSDEHRRPSKTCVLASIYSVTAAGLLEQLPVVCSGCKLRATVHTCGHFLPLWTENKCQDLINAFYLEYEGLMRMQKADHATMRRHAMMWDMFGRILHVQAVRSVHEWVVSGALREGSNFPIQSSAAGIFKLGMSRVWEDVSEGNMLDVVNFCLPIHDELLSVCRGDLADELIALNRARFNTCVSLDVPLESSGSKALSWGTLSK